MALFTAIQWPFFFEEGRVQGYSLNTIIMILMWLLMFVFSYIIFQVISKMTIGSIEKTLYWFFIINIIVIVFQYFKIAIEKKSILPYLISMGTGDYIKGVFTNSSVSMIIFSFYAIYFYFLKKIRLTILATLLMLASTYMSGIVIFVAVLLGYSFFFLTIKSQFKILVSLILGVLMFALLSPDNIDYVVENLQDTVLDNSNKARKIVSFKQTAGQLFSDLDNFIFGSGGGKYSSRTAFLTSGDYVSWFPENYSYMSTDFERDHYSLWNSKLLSLPYMDGTANQPFSFYNKIFGEYGILGFSIFIFFYLSKFLRNFPYLSYGKPLILLMLAYFILDYWYEYFTVILFYELFLQLDVRKNLIDTNE